MPRPLGAQISHMLKSRGVDVIFGIPGVHNQEMYRGIEEAGLTHVLARHEQGAGFMADGYARATGRPGLAFVITGPGLCNVMTPLGQAWSDSVPVLALSSCLNRADLGMGRGRLHEMKDQQGAGAAVCDWSLTAMDAQSAYQLIDRALAEFVQNRPRPKHIQVPIEVLEAAAPDAPPPVPAGAAMRGAGLDWPGVAATIARAERPLAIFGGGAIPAADLVGPFLARSGAASFTTYAGRGLVAPDDPLHFGACLARPDSAKVIAGADLVIAIGTQLSEVDLGRDTLGHVAPMIRIDIDPAELADQHRAEMPLLADARTALGALLDHLPQQTDSGWPGPEIARARARWRAGVAAEFPGIAPVADALRAALPAETMIFSDMTQFAYAAKEIWPMHRPGHWHHPYGFGTLGYALPAAIGGKIGLPERPVVAIAGDYGFQYTMPELAVAVELALPLPILLWDNGKLGEIEDSMVRAQIAPNAVLQRNPDFELLARAYGTGYARPGSLARMATDMQAALAADGPTLIHLSPALLG